MATAVTPFMSLKSSKIPAIKRYLRRNDRIEIIV